MKTSKTNATASSDNKEVRADATAEKRAAALKVAEEKCDALALSAKDARLDTAKAKFGKVRIGVTDSGWAFKAHHLATAVVTNEHWRHSGLRQGCISNRCCHGDC